MKDNTFLETCVPILGPVHSISEDKFKDTNSDNPKIN